ncbi:MAG: hypothetical protein V2A62_00695 [Candidatus Woesearchaeota archaeon]
MKLTTYFVPILLALGCYSPLPPVSVRCLNGEYVVTRETNPSKDKQELTAKDIQNHYLRITIESTEREKHVEIDNKKSEEKIFQASDYKPFDGSLGYFSINGVNYGKNSEKVSCYYDKKDGCRRHPEKRELAEALFRLGLCIDEGERVNRQSVVDKLK